MLKYNWLEFLNRVNEKILEDKDVLEIMNNPETLFCPPASEEQILENEARLNVRFPTSYKEFLLSSNGFKIISNFYWDILPVERIVWLKDFDPQLIDAYLHPVGFEKSFTVKDEDYFVYGEKQTSVSMRAEYLEKCLVVSDWGDSSLILLNPEIKFGGEWEAWAFANWYPGALRFKSFWDLVNWEFQGYLKLRSGH